MKMLRAYLLLFCQLLCFYSCSAQKKADKLLAECQAQLDSSQYETAFVLAQQAVTIAEQGADSQRHDAYCMAGLAALKSDRSKMEAYYQKLQSLSASQSASGEALRAYLEAQYYHAYPPDMAITLYEKAHALYKRLPGKIHPNAGSALINLAVLESDRKNHERGLSLLRDAHTILEACYGPEHPSVARVFHNLGYIQYRQGRFVEAKNNVERAMTIRKKKLNPYHREVVATYLQYGLVLNGLGRFEDALDYFEQARIDGEKVKGGAQIINYAKANIGLAYGSMGYFNLSKKAYYDILEDDKKIDNEDARKWEMATTYFNIAVAWKDESRFDSALYYYRMALQYSTPDHTERAYFLNGMGKAWEGLGRIDSAKHYFLEGYKLWTDAQSGQTRLAATSCFNLAGICLKQGRFSDALDWNEKGQDLFGYQNGDDLSAIFGLHNLCLLLSQEAQIKLNQSGKVNLRAAQESCDKAMLALQTALEAYDNGEAREAVNASEASMAYEQNILLNREISVQTGDKSYLEKSFLASEQAKARESVRLLKERDPDKNACYPTDLQKRESDLNDQHIQLKIQLEAMQRSKKWDSIKTRQSEIAKQLAAVRSTMRTAYPDCWHKQHKYESVGIAAIQQKVLEPSQALVECFLGQDSIFFFVVTKAGLKTAARKRHPQLKEWVEILSEKTENNNKPGDIAPVTTAAVHLYEVLIEPVIGYIRGHQRLTIVPDGILAKVPFHLLLKKQVEPGIWPEYQKNYLLHDFAISYQYSADMLYYLKTHKKQQEPSRYLLAGTPFANLNDSLEGVTPGDPMLSPLQNSTTETEAALAIWPGDKMQTNTIDEFWRMAPHYRMLHIPTHGKAEFKERKSSWLAFRNPLNPRLYDKLYAKEFFGKTLNADLTIFSACGSGKGRLRSREGVMAFAQAAMVAGSESAVVTLWNVKTRQSHEVITHFHRALRAGQPKDVALQTAMKQYLESTTGDGNFAHPFYWGHWMLYGNPEPIR